MKDTFYLWWVAEKGRPPLSEEAEEFAQAKDAWDSLWSVHRTANESETVDEHPPQDRSLTITVTEKADSGLRVLHVSSSSDFTFSAQEPTFSDTVVDYIRYWLTKNRP